MRYVFYDNHRPRRYRQWESANKPGYRMMMVALTANVMEEHKDLCSKVLRAAGNPRRNSPK